jgi:DNA mismatch repair protein MutL
MKARPVPQFAAEISARPTATPSLTSDSWPRAAGAAVSSESGGRDAGVAVGEFALQPQPAPAISGRLGFTGGIEVEANAAIPVARFPRQTFAGEDQCAAPAPEIEEPQNGSPPLASLRPLGQIRESFILAVNDEGLWIIDQHVAHERILFERVSRQRAAERVESQRLLMPLLVELTPAQQAVFTEISDELRHNGFEVEPFGTRTIAVKLAPAGVEASEIEHMLHELLDQFGREEQALNLDAVRNRIAASIACHAAIKVNMRLEQNKMEWLLRELAKTECPMTCPHGRPVVLRYSLQDIQRAFKRI